MENVAGDAFYGLLWHHHHLFRESTRLDSTLISRVVGRFRCKGNQRGRMRQLELQLMKPQNSTRPSGIACAKFQTKSSHRGQKLWAESFLSSQPPDSSGGLHPPQKQNRRVESLQRQAHGAWVTLLRAGRFQRDTHNALMVLTSCVLSAWIWCGLYPL